MAQLIWECKCGRGIYKADIAKRPIESKQCPECGEIKPQELTKMGRYRFYYDGKLSASSRADAQRAIRMIDAAQKDWSRNIMPQVEPGEFDPNNGSEVTRVSSTELLVTTTGGHKLRFVFVENN